MSQSKFDLLTLGRCSLDLFSEQIGADFVDIHSFSTQVGGSPTNIAIGTSRLGLKSAAVTAVGADPVGEFVRHYLSKEGVATEFVLTKSGRTPLAVVGIQPPSHFPLLFYRDDPPDRYIGITDVKTLPLSNAKMLLLAGSNFAEPDLRDASLVAAKSAQQHSVLCVIDLDLRPSLWSHPAAYAANMQAVWPHCELIIGTEEELWAALSDAPEQAWANMLDDEQRDELGRLILKHQRPEQTIALKRGPRGVTIYCEGEPPVEVSGFPVKILNTVGAGDAFASGLLFGRSRGWDWPKAARFGNACGALVVTRHGCSAAMPTATEAFNFIETQGGF